MLCVLAGAVINTVLDPILIFGFNMRMAGAAIATVVSQIISCVLVIRYLTKFKTFRITKEYLKPKFDYIKLIISLGAASCFNQLAITVAQIVMNNTLTHYGALSQYGADIPLACVGVISKVNVVLMAFILGISQGCQPIFGFNYGAKNYKRVKETLKISFITVTCIATFAFACFQLFPGKIVSIFGQGNEMYFKFAERYFRIFMFMTFLFGTVPLTSTFFTSMGKAPKGILISLTRQLIFLIPLVLILPVFMGIDGVMYAGPIADFAAILVAIILVFLELKKMTET
jgi:Na+-driven multidrug efflux pump